MKKNYPKIVKSNLNQLKRNINNIIPRLVPISKKNIIIIHNL